MALPKWWKWPNIQWPDIYSYLIDKHIHTREAAGIQVTQCFSRKSPLPCLHENEFNFNSTAQMHPSTFDETSCKKKKNNKIGEGSTEATDLKHVPLGADDQCVCTLASLIGVRDNGHQL